MRKLFEEYAEPHVSLRGNSGYKVRGITIAAFEKLCLSKDVFTIRQ
jgi:hypothetical protein